MKTLKWLFFLILVLTLMGGSFYLPLSRHLVVFKTHYHLVQKDSLSWDNTFIDLDKNPLQWRLVIESKHLRSYFLSHYRTQLQAQLEKKSSSLWQQLKRQTTKSLNNLKQKIQSKLTKESMNKITKQAKKELLLLRKKTNKMLHQPK